MWNNLTQEELNSAGVYKITTPSGRIYIGMTTRSFIIRWKEHIRRLELNNHYNTGLQNSYNHYGHKIDLFSFDILYSININNFNEIEEATLANTILNQEKIEWIKHKNSGYILLNACPTGTGSVHHSENTKKKLSETFNLMYQNKLQKNFYNQLDLVKTLAINENISITEMSNILEVGKKALIIEMRRNSIKFQYIDPSLSTEDREKLSKVRYINDPKTYIDLMDENQNIFDKDQILKIRIDSSYVHALLGRKEELLDLYFNHHYSTTQLAKIYGISQPIIISVFNQLRSSDDRFKSVRQGSNRSDKKIVKSNESIEKFKKTFQENSIKINCQYCDKLIYKNQLERHENSCKNWPHCVVCKKRLSKKTAKVCRDHYKN